MLVVLFLILSARCLEVPEESAALVQRHSWTHVNDHDRSPCVAVDAYVRPYGQNLIVSLIGHCDGMKLANTWCEIKLSSRQTKRLQKAVDVKLGPQTEVRGNKQQQQFSPGKQQAQQPAARSWSQFAIDCGPVNQKGQVSIKYGSNSTLSNINFSMPVPLVELSGSAICTRLYDNKGWTTSDTIVFIEWLEWQIAIGFSTVHVYIHSLSSPELWQALTAYAKDGHVVMHAWSDSDGSEPDSVTRSTELAQIAYLADCYMRLEGTVLYMTALDHGEFLQTTDISETLDIHYLSRNVQSNVVVVEPQTVIPEECEHDGDVPMYVTLFCKGHDSTANRHKIIIRSNKDKPFALFPSAHMASDGRPISRMQRQSLGLLHIGRLKSYNPSTGKKVSIMWNEEVARSVAKSLTARTAVNNLYSALKTGMIQSDESSAACFKFIDAGADAGDSLLRLTRPERYPRSGLANVAKTLEVNKYECRQLFAFDADPKNAEKLRSVCTELMQQNYTCTPIDGILMNQAGLMDFYVDGKSTQSQLGPSIYNRPGATVIEVIAYDAAAFIRSVAVPADYVVMKLDVEGSEYDVLQALVAGDRFKPCKLIDLLLIEWHGGKFLGVAAGARKELQDRYDGTLETQQNRLVEALKQCGVDVRTSVGVTD